MRDRLIVSEYGSLCYLNRFWVRILVFVVLRSIKRIERQWCIEKMVFYFLGGLQERINWMGLFEVIFQLDLLIVVFYIGFIGYLVDLLVENNFY